MEPPSNLHGALIGSQPSRHDNAAMELCARFVDTLVDIFASSLRRYAEALALRVLADRLEHAEAGPDLVSVTFRAA
jgi:hypothetical protein